jgi:hypothetical protein
VVPFIICIDVNKNMKNLIKKMVAKPIQSGYYCPAVSIFTKSLHQNWRKSATNDAIEYMQNPIVTKFK